MIRHRDKGIPKDRWIPSSEWDRITRRVNLTTCDLVIQRSDGALLFGRRVIQPYRGKWALVGGVVLRGESLYSAAKRIAAEYEMTFQELYLIGVFPARFKFRSDVVTALAGLNAAGEPRVDGKGFSGFRWFRQPPRGLGLNYRRIITKWNAMKRKTDFMSLNAVRPSRA
ncbi:MAG: NUDIX domain-containing protein [Nitrososphaerota archaeon]|nr:NUDIX domain-containing protein [Nitrososphaerota archaeon]